MESLSIIFTIAGFLIPVLVIGGTIGIIIYAVNNKDKKFNLNIRILLNLYFYVMIFFMILIGIGGLSTLTKSGLSYAFGIPFVYNLETPNRAGVYDTNEYTTKPIVDSSIKQCYTGEITKINNKEYCFDKETQKKDMLMGLTLFLSMAILLAIHIIGLNINSKAEPTLFLKKTYLFLSLGLYGIMSIVLLPTTIYMLVDYALYDQSDLTNYARTIPGQPLAWLIFALPLWIYYMVRVLRLREKHEEIVG